MRGRGIGPLEAAVALALGALFFWVATDDTPPEDPPPVECCNQDGEDIRLTGRVTIETTPEGAVILEDGVPFYFVEADDID